MLLTPFKAGKSKPKPHFINSKNKNLFNHFLPLSPPDSAAVIFKRTLSKLYYLTWFFPLSTSTLVTLPNGMPKCMTSASVTSFGMLRMCITRDGLLLAVLSSLTCIQKNKRWSKGGGRQFRAARQVHTPGLPPQTTRIQFAVRTGGLLFTACSLPEWKNKKEENHYNV